MDWVVIAKATQFCYARLHIRKGKPMDHVNSFAVPTAVGVVGSMTVVYVSDRRKRHIIETTAN